MSSSNPFKPEQLRAAYQASNVFSPEAMGAVMRMQANLFDAWMKTNIEMLDFLKHRFEEDRKLAARIGDAGDPAAAMNMYADFWRTAMSDYAGEADKLAKMNADAAEQAGRMAEDIAEEAVDGVSRTKRRSGSK